MQTKFGIDVRRDGGKAFLFEKLVELQRQPTNLCKSCGTNLDFNGCFCNSVAIVETCELGEHCRCKSFDAAYKADCWNWIGKVTL